MKLEPWNEPNDHGELPGDICCQRSVGGRCYEHNKANYNLFKLYMNYYLAYIYNQLQTTIHKFWVAFYIVKACGCLLKRAIVHDLSKYGNSEAPYFAKNIFKLKNTVYGTPEYQKLLDEIRPALEHHYKHNTHHPEFHPNGIRDMSTLDQLEMLCDWKAATRRHKKGSIYYSVVINAKRFGYSEIEQKALIRDCNEIF